MANEVALVSKAAGRVTGGASAAVRGLDSGGMGIFHHKLK